MENHHSSAAHPEINIDDTDTYTDSIKGKFSPEINSEENKFT